MAERTGAGKLKPVLLGKQHLRLAVRNASASSVYESKRSRARGLPSLVERAAASDAATSDSGIVSSTFTLGEPIPDPGLPSTTTSLPLFGSVMGLRSSDSVW